MNKYKRALVSLAKIAFLEEPNTEYGDNVVRQILYRHLYSLKIIDYKDGKFIYKGKEKNEGKKITDNNPFNVFSDDASLLSGVISSVYKEAEIREEVRKETAKDILKSLKFLYAERQKEYTNWDGNKINAVTTKWLNADIECIAKEYGIELFGKTEQVGNPDKLEDEV